MKYGFVLLKNDDGSVLYMDPKDFERYEAYDVFKAHAESLVVFDSVYIGCFPLIFNESEILEFNPDAHIVCVLPFTDLAFRSSKISRVALSLDCDNCRGLL